MVLISPPLTSAPSPDLLDPTIFRPTLATSHINVVHEGTQRQMPLSSDVDDTSILTGALKTVRLHVPASSAADVRLQGSPP